MRMKKCSECLRSKSCDLLNDIKRIHRKYLMNIDNEVQEQYTNIYATVCSFYKRVKLDGCYLCGFYRGEGYIKQKGINKPYCALGTDLREIILEKGCDNIEFR